MIEFTKEQRERFGYLKDKMILKYSLCHHCGGDEKKKASCLACGATGTIEYWESKQSYQFKACGKELDMGDKDE